MQNLIFLHIAKVGGMTFRAIIARQFPKDAVFLTYGGTEKDIRALAGLPEEHRQRIQCVSGHMPFGVHEYFSQPFGYIAFIRNPADRILSEYYYARGSARSGHYAHTKMATTPLRQYVAEGGVSVSNFQTRVLAGQVASGITRWDTLPMPGDALARAKKNIHDHFAFVGVVDRFDESLLVCKKKFGWDDVRYILANVTKERPRRETTAIDVMQIIQKNNTQDAELYAYANALLDESIREYGPSFTRDLKLFRLRNKMFRTFEHPLKIKYKHIRYRVAKACGFGGKENIVA